MKHAKLTTKENLIPFILITALFFLWGMAHGMLDVLNKHFQDVLQISKARSGLIQFSVYMAYFSMALPAGYFMRRFGYKKGIILGLLLFATGAYLIVPASLLQSFWLFLIGLFILGCGLTTLETAANPYTTKLGPKESAERRINFSQSFNGLAWIIGPIIGGLFILGNDGGVSGNKLESLMTPYIVIGTVVLIIAGIYVKTPLPEIEEEVEHHGTSKDSSSILHKPLIKQRHFVLGVVAQFCYVAAQTGVFSFFVNFVTDKSLTPHFENKTAALMLGMGGMSLFMIGRVLGSWMMGYLKPTKILAFYSIMCCLLLPVVSLSLGWSSIIALFLIFFFMSIMFPTIFALGIKDLGEKTKQGASFIVMAIVGGAIFPMFMGWIADISSMSIGFLAPIPLFAFILYYAVEGHKVVRS
ncbi:MAG: L-fucose:H+ symporter permease [Bacteroidia bacterium]|nr:L-fucose:H+ symporter permease [Bacteroidia bacterium]